MCPVSLFVIVCMNFNVYVLFWYMWVCVYSMVVFDSYLYLYTEACYVRNKKKPVFGGLSTWASLFLIGKLHLFGIQHTTHHTTDSTHLTREPKYYSTDGPDGRRIPCVCIVCCLVRYGTILCYVLSYSFHIVLCGILW